MEFDYSSISQKKLENNPYKRCDSDTKNQEEESCCWSFLLSLIRVSNTAITFGDRPAVGCCCRPQQQRSFVVTCCVVCTAVLHCCQFNAREKAKYILVSDGKWRNGHKNLAPSQWLTVGHSRSTVLPNILRPSTGNVPVTCLRRHKVYPHIHTYP